MASSDSSAVILVVIALIVSSKGALPKSIS